MDILGIKYVRDTLFRFCFDKIGEALQLDLSEKNTACRSLFTCSYNTNICWI